MSNIKDLFVSYEIAKQLKEKGFNEPCFGFYTDIEGIGVELNYFSKRYDNHNFRLEHSDEARRAKCTAPLYQQVIMWFYDNHETIIVQLPSYSMKVWEVSKKGHKDVISGLSINKAIEEAIKLI